MAGSASIAFLIPGPRPDIQQTSCVAIIVKNRVALPRSPSPLLKKKLAPSCCQSAKARVTVRAIVDFPVPAAPFSQNIGLQFLSSAQPSI